ncbi:reverse transcriptase [Senna tora]|uniref:Reverse transcriptase n=1 Tax=Senna tora TaxID=362788 RepID=A0A834WW75_9FABA|nr:reverse transcriptase [Senna tora]
MENASEKMKFIEDPKARNETFLKLKAEMLKEVSELSAFYGAEFAIFFNLPSGETYAYGYPSVETIIDRYCSTNLVTTEKEEEPHLQTTKSNSQTRIGSDKGKKRVLDMQDYDSGAQVEAENKKIKKLTWLEAIPAMEFDHTPLILIFFNHNPKTCKSFKFEQFRLENEQCILIIRDAWLKNCHALISNEISIEGNMDEIRYFKRKFAKLRRQEEQFWESHARNKWLRSGDKNTRFFHAVTMQRRRINRIS